jgi:hypothetical protein
MKPNLPGFLATLGLVAASLAVSGCGRVTDVENDTNKNVYVDFILPKVPRKLATQRVTPGQGFANPHCWKDAGTLYLGTEPGKAEERAYAGLCQPTACNCTVTVTQLERANR